MKAAIQLTAKIWEARDAMKGLFQGAAYNSKTQPWREAIKTTMEKAGCNELEAILHIQQLIERKTKLNGVEIALLFSAAADLIEENESQPAKV